MLNVNLKSECLEDMLSSHAPRLLLAVTVTDQQEGFAFNDLKSKC